MAPRAARFKACGRYGVFTASCDAENRRVAACDAVETGGRGVGFLAITLFVMLMAFGKSYFGWSDPQGWTTIALVCSFIFGIIAGMKARG